MGRKRDAAPNRALSNLRKTEAQREMDDSIEVPRNRRERRLAAKQNKKKNST